MAPGTSASCRRTTTCHTGPSYCSSLSSISLPPGLKRIQYEAFRESGLRSIDFSGTGLLHIERDAFRESTALTSVTFAASLTQIDKKAFYSAGLTSIDVSGTSLKYIGEDAFSQTKQLVGAGAEVTLPSSLTGMGWGVFSSSVVTALYMDATALTYLPVYTCVYCYSPASDPTADADEHRGRGDPEFLESHVHLALSEWGDFYWVASAGQSREGDIA